MRNILIIAGNGLTIDLLTKIGANNIDTSNLFANGDKIVYPDGNNEIGFLSRRFCENLWSLGARPYLSENETNNLIEEILSCANAIFENKLINTDSVYVKAFNELSTYLKHLFIRYNNEVTDDQLRKVIEKQWGWIRLLDTNYNDPDCENIWIVSYNYDIFLERVLRLLEYDFDVAGFGDTKCKIKIIKPHGSISFCHKITMEKNAYRVKNKVDSDQAYLSNFVVKYDNLDDNYVADALIPPSGESGRLYFKWAEELRAMALSAANSIKEKDKVYITGISYWNVDRSEIDEMLATIDKLALTHLINPKPNRALNAVITCLFKNFIFYSNSDILGGMNYEKCSVETK